MIHYFLIVLCCFLLFFVNSDKVFALAITEIMYDPQGSDTGYEWIEVFNDESEDVDINNYYLTESGVNHSIKTISTISSPIVGVGEYAVIADNIQKFTEQYPSYNGKLFDSTFSLSNEGEELLVSSKEGIVLNKIVYPNTIANGDGNSLNYVNGAFYARKPSPGKSIEEQSITPTQTANKNSNVVSAIHKKTKSTLDIALSTEIPYAYAGIPFQLEQLINYGPPERTTQYKWNFGDGTIGIGKNISHTFLFPDDYLVRLEVKKKNPNQLDIPYETVFTISVSESLIYLECFDYNNKRFIQVNNKGNAFIDISSWFIYSNTQRKNIAVLPYSTYLYPHKKVTLSLQKENIVLQDEYSLLYKNKKIAHAFICKEGLPEREVPPLINTNIIDLDDEEEDDAEKDTITWKGEKLLVEEQERLQQIALIQAVKDDNNVESNSLLDQVSYDEFMDTKEESSLEDIDLGEPSKKDTSFPWKTILLFVGFTGGLVVAGLKYIQDKEDDIVEYR